MNSFYVKEQNSLETILLMGGGEYRMVTLRLFWGFQNSRLRFKHLYQFRALSTENFKLMVQIKLIKIIENGNGS